ncbi:MAG: 3-dehydroquinate synthase [Phycisphaerales bacterium JB063]
MPTVRLTLPQCVYDIVIEPGVLSRAGERVRAAAPHARAAVVADEAVASTYGRAVGASLEASGYDTAQCLMPARETHKTLETVASLLDTMLEHRMERRSPVVAVGGGITGDVAGYTAASLLRGVPFVQCPTTLLAMVDASVGGKTGVNTRQGKNLVGAFHQPAAVLIDPDTLATLPARELRGGLAECVKHGVIRDADLFDWITANVDGILGLDRATLVELVRRNVAIKAAVVQEDEKEQGVRAHLNFGHTFAHAIEATQDKADGADPYSHGEAVALGMVAATRLAVDAGRCDASVYDRLVALLERIGLPTSSDRLAADEALLGVMASDKKVRDGRVRLVLPDAMGAVSVVDDTPGDAVRSAWASVRVAR